LVRKQKENYTKGTRLIQESIDMNILRNPTTIKALATEIIKACDSYLALRLSENSLRDLIWHYGQAHGTKIFNGNKLNPTILNRIGKKRAYLVEEMLNGFQFKML
jgi:uncharacterized protein (TIGR04540 family)